MPAKDRFHDAVKNGLIRDGWEITADPLYLQVGRVEMYVDLAAEKLLAAEKEGRKIAIEIKSFIGTSLITDFHMAIGQFINYRHALGMSEPGRLLYLAVPDDTYRSFFSLSFVQGIISDQEIRIIVYDAEQENIVKWIE